MFLSSTLRVAVFRVVVVPCTVKSPATITEVLDAPIVRLFAPTPSNIVLLPDVKSRSVKPVRAVSKLSVTLPEVPPPLRFVPATTAVISPTEESEPAQLLNLQRNFPL